MKNQDRYSKFMVKAFNEKEVTNVPTVFSQFFYKNKHHRWYHRLKDKILILIGLKKEIEIEEDDFYDDEYFEIEIERGD